MISFFQAIVLGLLQGISELFPISSLGHSVLFAWLFGWHNIVADQSQTESFFLAFLVMLHLGTALALLIYYRAEWIRIIKGFIRTLPKRKIEDSSEKLAWLLIVATIPTGLLGLIFEHSLRTQFAKPLSATIFLLINGLILLTGDMYIRKNRIRKPRRDFDLAESRKQATSKITFSRSITIGIAQTFALLAGISRSGVTMVSGIYSGLDYEDAARFSFLLATPVILGAAILKLPDVFGSLGNGVRGQILAGGLAAGIAAYFAVRFLDKYFRNKTLRPFGIYCLVVGVLMLLVAGVGLRHF